MELKEWKKIHTNPNAADFYRRMYPGVVVRGYHCPPVQQPYWNTIELEQFDEETAELKRVFVDRDYRGKGIAKELLRRIEADARISGYRFMVLETGALL